MAGTSDYREFAWTALRGSTQATDGYRYRLKALQYFGFDGNYDLVNDNVWQGKAAPVHILLDNLREAFWYNDDPATRTSPPLSLFDLVACDVVRDAPDVAFPDVP